MENATKSTWITNSKRFALEAESFEKKGAIFLRLVTEIADLHKESSDYEQERIESKHSLARRMSNFKSLLSEIQSRLQNDNWLSPHHDIQRQLEQFEEKMTAFKLSMRNDFDVMECTSRDIEGDIIQLAKHIDNWSKEGPNYSIPLADVDQDDLRDGDSKRQKDRCKNDIERRARVGAIDRRLAGFKKNDGWDARDHDAFVRIWNQVFDMNELLSGRNQRMKDLVDASRDEIGKEIVDASLLSINVDQLFVLPQTRKRLLLKKFSLAVPVKNDEEHENHITWYLQHLHLSELKKSVVSEWKKEQERARRMSKQDAIISEVLESEECIGDIDGLLSRHQSEANVLQRQVAEAERVAAKVRIAKWKADCAAKKREEEITAAQRQIHDKTREEEERSKRQQRVRAQLQEWKRSEEISKEAAKDLNADCARPKVHDAAILRQLQNRDLDAAKARQKKVDEINQSKLQREAKIKEATAALLSTPYVERDPNRLIAPTKAYERGVLKAEDLDVAERRRSSAGAHGARVPLQGRDLHNIGRATPSWCKAMK